MSKPHVLIIGGGITGLLLAQALKKNNVSFSIFERDTHESSRDPGWGLAIHWAKQNLISLLPIELQEGLMEVNVDPDAARRGDCGRFPYFDLRNGQERYTIPSEERIRLSRGKWRNLLMRGLTVEWEKKLEQLAQDPVDSSITAHFTDGSSAHGTHVVGCDGSHSRVRQILCGLGLGSPINQRLPVRFLGSSVVFDPAVAAQLQEKDTLFCQGGDANSDTFMFLGLQDTPRNNDRGDRNYLYQVSISWPYKENALGQNEPMEVPEEQMERHALIRKFAKAWAAPFRDAVYNMPTSLPLQEIRIEYWMPGQNLWDNMNGRATLLGDAAHTMPMFRGEACNHAIVDVEQYVKCHLNVLLSTSEGFEEACSQYESEMIERTENAIWASVQACLDAHNQRDLNANSPLVATRAIAPQAANIHSILQQLLVK